MNELTKCNTFEEFFIEVSKLRVSETVDGLRELRKTLSETTRFDREAIVYLMDCIDIEIVNNLKTSKNTENTESQMKKRVVEKFSELFPDFEFIKTEYEVPTGRIDILANEISSNRPAIIELKINKGNPNKQLIAYGSHFINPILIGVTQEELPERVKLEEIRYVVIGVEN